MGKLPLNLTDTYRAGIRTSRGATPESSRLAWMKLVVLVVLTLFASLGLYYARLKHWLVL